MLLLPRRSPGLEASESRLAYDLQFRSLTLCKCFDNPLLLSYRAAVSGVPQEQKQQQLNSHCDIVLIVATRFNTTTC